MRKHSTDWEDSESAGLVCEANGKRVDTGKVINIGEPAICPNCKATVKLLWQVSVEEVAPVESAK